MPAFHGVLRIQNYWATPIPLAMRESSMHRPDLPISLQYVLRPYSARATATEIRGDDPALTYTQEGARWDNLWTRWCDCYCTRNWQKGRWSVPIDRRWVRWLVPKKCTYGVQKSPDRFVCSISIASTEPGQIVCQELISLSRKKALTSQNDTRREARRKGPPWG